LKQLNLRNKKIAVAFVCGSPKPPSVKVPGRSNLSRASGYYACEVPV